jgi:RNAse (barnase) inhibitor barstar
MNNSFEFAQQSPPGSDQEFQIKVPPYLQTKEELFSAYKKSGKFPGHFGRNWDALYDCLCDFSWIEQETIVIIHQDLPLESNAAELNTYLGILSDAIQTWQQERADNEDNIWVSHELKVVFPASAQPTITKLLASAKS